MNRKKFNSLKEVLNEIINSNYDRNLAFIIGFHFSSDESITFNYNAKLNKYGFFFEFLEIHQKDLNNIEFIDVINKLYKIDLNNLLSIKSIIFYKELNNINDKFNRGVINDSIFNQLKDNLLKN